MPNGNGPTPTDRKWGEELGDKAGYLVDPLFEELVDVRKQKDDLTAALEAAQLRNQELEAELGQMRVKRVDYPTSLEAVWAVMRARLEQRLKDRLAALQKP